MNNKILEGYLKDFSKVQGFEEMAESTLFEYFTNNVILSKMQIQDIDLEEVHIGGANDGGIDGIAITVNDHLVQTIDEVKYHKNNLGRLEVKFYFIQSKTSATFDMAEIGIFLFGVHQFFEEQPGIKLNTKIENLMEVKNYIYSDENIMDLRPLPECHMYYVSTGVWKEDSTLVGKIEFEKNTLVNKNIFSDVFFHPIDNAEIQTLYREIRNKIDRCIEFERHVIMPAIDNVEEAYLGILSCKEYLKLITDDESNLMRNLFYDNVRDFQGDNPVNKEIEETIRNVNNSDKFVLLNNGVTVVAKEVKKVGTKFTIRDYQIVNGCQTSHIIHRNRDRITDKMNLPIKVIVTRNSSVMNQITRATNRQTPVTNEAFEALEPYQKLLEEYYDNATEVKLYYERRSHQYDELSIPRNKIISLTTQIKSFLAMFLNEPHSTHRYYGELLKSKKSILFNNQHSPVVYYVSGLAYYMLEECFKKNKIEKKYRAYRYHILMLFRIVVGGYNMPALTSKKNIERYCETLIDILKNPIIIERVYGFLVLRLDEILIKEQNMKEAFRVKKFTDSIIESYKCVYMQGIAKKVLENKGYGYIERKGKSDLRFYLKDVVGAEIYEKDKVVFRIEGEDDKSVAMDIIPIS